MKLYAETPGRRARQLMTDVLVLAWTLLWIWLADVAHGQVLRLGEPGRDVEQAGEGIAANLRQAGATAGDVPVIGGALRAPLESAGDAGRSLADAGRAQQESVHDLAVLAAVLLVALPVGYVVLKWLPARWRWSREATAARELLDEGENLTVFAVRALAHQPLARLAWLDPGTTTAWQRGDQDATERLAALELSSIGLRQPGTGRSGQGSPPGRSAS